MDVGDLETALQYFSESLQHSMRCHGI